MDDIERGLPAQHTAVQELVHLVQGLVHRVAKQVDFHTGLAGFIQLHAGGAVGFGGLALLHLVRCTQVGERHLRFHDAGADLDHIVAVGAGRDGGRLAKIRNDDLLADLHFFEWDELFDRLRLGVGLFEQCLGVLAGNFPGTHGTLGGAGLFVLLDAAQFIGQAVRLVLHLLHQVMGLAAGVFEFFLTFFN